jgi:hypothetical protein
MADFCSLCGYTDIDITALYNELLKPTIAEDIVKLDDGRFLVINLGVCEHCAIVSFGVNNKYEVWGGYYEKENHQIGNVNKDTLELEIFEDDPWYAEQKEKMKVEEKYFKKDIKIMESFIPETDIYPAFTNLQELKEDLLEKGLSEDFWDKYNTTMEIVKSTMDSLAWQKYIQFSEENSTNNIDELYKLRYPNNNE